MSKHFDHHLKKRDEAITRIRDTYSMAKLCGLPHAELLESLSSIQESIKSCPDWVKCYCQGYKACLADKLYGEALVFGGFIGDTFYSTHNSRADYYGKHGIEPSAYADDGRVHSRGHYWNPDNFKGIAKPFFVKQSNN